MNAELKNLKKLKAAVESAQAAVRECNTIKASDALIAARLELKAALQVATISNRYAMRCGYLY